MTEGYYELVFKRSTDDYKYGKSFYLLDNGPKKSSIIMTSSNISDHTT